MTTRERCLQLACSWRSCSSSRPQVAAWCHPMWSETSTNGRMISLTLLSRGLTLRWNLWLHHYSRSSRSSLGYYNILMHKVIFLDRSQSSLPLLLQSWRRGGRVSTGFGWSYSPRTLSWERSLSLILTLPTCGLRTGDLPTASPVGTAGYLVHLTGTILDWPRTLLVSLDTCQQARVAQTGTQTQKEKVLLLLLLGCCLNVSSVGLFSWLADMFDSPKAFKHLAKSQTKLVRLKLILSVLPVQGLTSNDVKSFLGTSNPSVPSADGTCHSNSWWKAIAETRTLHVILFESLWLGLDLQGH